MEGINCRVDKVGAFPQAKSEAYLFVIGLPLTVTLASRFLAFASFGQLQKAIGFILH